MIDEIKYRMKHYWQDHKSVVIVVGVLLVIAYIL